ncbi:MAG: SMP-30/gluconolactonase/LRE family protein [Bryobacterales bacterium]
MVYFTDPNGCRGEAAPGTVYRIDAQAPPASSTTPSSARTTLCSAPTTARSTSRTTSARILQSWWAGPCRTVRPCGVKEVLAKFDPCVADGMAVDAKGRIWVTCYSYGTAHLIDPATGVIVERVTTEQKALTSAVFGRQGRFAFALSLQLGHGPSHGLRIQGDRRDQ